jgi:hypothetical protein
MFDYGKGRRTQIAVKLVEKTSSETKARRNQKDS